MSGSESSTASTPSHGTESGTEDISSTIQLIGEDKQFNDQILEYVDSKVVSSAIGLNYHVISVFGSQSTGKSTLLNTLFNTRFDVMNEIQRKQTTKGIWMAYANEVATTSSRNSANSSNIFVMDVEGTDGRERGEDQDFERKAALFALATSEVLIVNIWESQVGLYQGANMGLLKTVFEVNLSLFAKQHHKCLLLFVIRDHLGVTPLQNLTNTLIQDLENIWDQLNKPTGTETSSVHDFFDLAFHGLPHKVLQPDKFVDGVKLLGDKLNLPDEPESYLFKKDYHRSLPIDGWTLYAEKCWEQIELNKDLDLPTQQILVARFRCDEIANGSYEEFSGEFDSKITKNLAILENGKELGALFVVLKENALQKYDLSASKYNNEVYLKRRDQLKSQIQDDLKTVFGKYLVQLRKSAIGLFNLNLKKRDKNESFNKVIENSHSSATSHFLENALLANLNGELAHESDLKELHTSLDDIIDQERVKEIDLTKKRIEKRFQSLIKEDIISLLSNPNKSTWDNVLGLFKSREETVLQRYSTDKGYDFGFGVPDTENSLILSQLKKSFWLNVYNIIKDFAKEENLSIILRDRFEDKFRYDNDGVPRLFKKPEEVDLNYRLAKEYALNIIPILSIAKLSNGSEILPDVEIFEDDEDEEDSLADIPRFAHILNSKQRDSITGKFKKQADAIYIEAKRSTIQSITQIPYYVYLIIMVLGWNEFLAVIRNPLFFTLLLLIAAGSYVAHTLHLWGPIMTVLNAVMDQSMKIAKDKLRQILEPSEPRPMGVYAPKKESVVENIELDDLNDQGEKM